MSAFLVNGNAASGKSTFLVNLLEKVLTLTDFTVTFVALNEPDGLLSQRDLYEHLRDVPNIYQRLFVDIMDPISPEEGLSVCEYNTDVIVVESMKAFFESNGSLGKGGFNRSAGGFMSKLDQYAAICGTTLIGVVNPGESPDMRGNAFELLKGGVTVVFDLDESNGEVIKNNTVLAQNGSSGGFRNDQMRVSSRIKTVYTPDRGVKVISGKAAMFDMAIQFLKEEQPRNAYMRSRYIPHYARKIISKAVQAIEKSKTENGLPIPTDATKILPPVGGLRSLPLVTPPIKENFEVGTVVSLDRLGFTKGNIGSAVYEVLPKQLRIVTKRSGQVDKLFVPTVDDSYFAASVNGSLNIKDETFDYQYTVDLPYTIKYKGFSNNVEAAIGDGEFVELTTSIIDGSLSIIKRKGEKLTDYQKVVAFIVQYDNHASKFFREVFALVSQLSPILAKKIGRLAAILSEVRSSDDLIATLLKYKEENTYTQVTINNHTYSIADLSRLLEIGDNDSLLELIRPYVVSLLVLSQGIHFGRLSSEDIEVR